MRLCLCKPPSVNNLSARQSAEILNAHLICEEAQQRARVQESERQDLRVRHHGAHRLQQLAARRLLALHRKQQRDGADRGERGPHTAQTRACIEVVERALALGAGAGGQIASSERAGGADGGGGDVAPGAGREVLGAADIGVVDGHGREHGGRAARRGGVGDLHRLAGHADEGSALASVRR